MSKQDFTPLVCACRAFVIRASVIASSFVFRHSTFPFLLLPFFVPAAAQLPSTASTARRRWGRFRRRCATRPWSAPTAGDRLRRRRRPAAGRGRRRQAGNALRPGRALRRSARTASGGVCGRVRRAVVRGGQRPAAAGQQRVGPPVFSPTATGWRTPPCRPTAEHVAVIEATKPPGKPYEQIFEGQDRFQPRRRDDSPTGPKAAGKWYVVSTARRSGRTNSWARPRHASSVPTAPLGLCVHGQKEMVRGARRPAAAGLRQHCRPGLQPRRQRLAYAALAGGKWRIVLDGQQQKPYDAIGEGTLQFSPDGNARLHRPKRAENG